MLSEDNDNLGAQLSAYLDGELSAVEAAEVERRLQADPPARELLSELRRTVELVQGLPRRVAPAGLHDELSARLDQVQPSDRWAAGKRSIRGARRSVGRPLAAAAVLAFAAGAAFWVVSRTERGPSGSAYQVASAEKERVLSKAPRASATDPPSAAPGPGQGGVSVMALDTQRKSEPGRYETSATGLSPAPEGTLDRATAPTPVQPASDIPVAPPASVAEPPFPGGTAGEPSEAEPRLALAETDARSTADEHVLADAAQESLEAKLFRGVRPPEILQHPFGNEAIRLEGSFGAIHERETVRGQLRAFLDSRQVRPLAEVAVDDDVPVPLSLPFFVEATPSSDSADEASVDRRMLVRLPVSELDRLVTVLGASTDPCVRLEVAGHEVASGTDRVREFLRSSSAQLSRMSAGQTEGPLAAAEGGSTPDGSARRDSVHGRVMPNSVMQGISALRPKDTGPSTETRGPRPSAPEKRATPAESVPAPSTRSPGPPTTGPKAKSATRPADHEAGRGESSTAPAAETGEELVTVVLSLRTSSAESKGPDMPPSSSSQPNR